MCYIKKVTINRDSRARPPPGTPQNRLVVRRFAPRNNSNRSECIPANLFPHDLIRPKKPVLCRQEPKCCISHNLLHLNTARNH